MTWKEIGPYLGHTLWVREVSPEGWLVGMVPDRSAPAGRANRVPPSEDQALPEAFPSEIAAVAAAMRFLDREQGRRNAPRPPQG